MVSLTFATLIFDADKANSRQYIQALDMCNHPLNFSCISRTLCNWSRQAERDAGKRSELTTEEQARIEGMEHEGSA